MIRHYHDGRGEFVYDLNLDERTILVLSTPKSLEVFVTGVGLAWSLYPPIFIEHLLGAEVLDWLPDQ